MNGFGEMHWSEDEVYLGYWENGIRHGVGI
jgi:hypothetical protein